VRVPPIAFIAITSVLFSACEQPQQPGPPSDTTALDTAGWERIELAPGALSVSVSAINDNGAIVGTRADSALGVSHPFIYENGVIRALLTNGRDAAPSAINSSGVIAGLADPKVVVAWDSPDAVLRPMDVGLHRDDAGVYVVAVNDHGDILAQVNEHDGLDGHGHALFWRNGRRQDLGHLAADTGIGYPSTLANRDE
jgi:uncharacterized membrane protein